MDEATARWLVSEDAAEVIAAGDAEPDPESLAAATRLRRLATPEQAAAVVTQTILRRRAAAKLGPRAASLWLTPEGLEQASRPDVAAWRAARFLASGATRVVDLGCGLGLDSLAMAEAGLAVVGVERDPVTAVLAAANLEGRGEVLTGDAVTAWRAFDESGPDTAVFADPARRSARGRSWRIEDLSPSWEFVRGLLDGGRPACVKLGPGVPWSVLPEEAEAIWVSSEGDLVEASVWAGPTAGPGERSAWLLPGDHRLDSAPPATDLAAAVQPGQFLYEPDPAVIRAGASPRLASILGARPLATGIAYLVADQEHSTPFAQGFEVLEVLDYDEGRLREWVREHRVGTLEIKKRGVDVDPAALRRRLRPGGTGSATLIITPTAVGVRTLVVRRTWASPSDA